MLYLQAVFLHFFFSAAAPPEIATLSLHDALPISAERGVLGGDLRELGGRLRAREDHRSEEHTSELQSQSNLVCRLLLEKKNAPPAGPLKLLLSPGSHAAPRHLTIVHVRLHVPADP